MMNIIEMAREAGIKSGDIYKLTVGHMSIETLERFAALVEAAARADEREACAKLCDEIGEESDTFTRDILRCTAAAIRARGTT
jgi:hypothetical protein